MREILFRGKRVDNGEWIYGSLICRDSRCYIVDESDRIALRKLVTHYEDKYEYRCVRVVPESVGQFTGLTDKNGKKIFEGDIIHSFYANCPKNEHIEKVTFFDGCFTAESASSGCYASIAGQDSPKHFAFDKSVYMIECEVIGNIHDNPELLGGGDNA